MPRTQTTADLSLRPTVRLLRLHNHGGLWWGTSSFRWGNRGVYFIESYPQKGDPQSYFRWQTLGALAELSCTARQALGVNGPRAGTVSACEGWAFLLICPTRVCTKMVGDGRRATGQRTDRLISKSFKLRRRWGQINAEKGSESIPTPGRSTNKRRLSTKHEPMGRVSY